MRRPHRNPGIAYQNALDQLALAERKLARAFNAWDKSRRALARAERRLDKAASTS